MKQNVLLTGATGALGPILAAELLHGGAAAQLNVLIRSNKHSAHQRFDRWIETVQAVFASMGAKMPALDRLGLIGGDLCVDGLGMSDAHQADVADETDVIIHCAADTNFRGGNHWETNVEGTRRVLDVARQCRRLKKFIQISTICAAGVQTGSIREEAITPEPTFANAYERTKWEAERLVLASDLPVEIVRVGIIMGSRVTGTVYRLGAFHHVVKWFGTGQMPVVPGTPATPVDLIDTELAAKLVSKAAAVPSTPGAIYHAAAGNRAVLLEDLVSFCAEQMLDEARRSEASLLGHHERHSPQHERLAKAWLPVLLAGRTYDTTQAEKLWGGPLPLADWRETLAKMIKFCGFGSRNTGILPVS